MNTPAIFHTPMAALIVCAAWLFTGSSLYAQGTPPPAYQLSIEAPRSLAPLLQSHLDLSRFQAQAKDTVITNEELTRLIGATPSQVRALVETEGFFNAQVAVEVGPMGEEPRKIQVRVEPGTQARVRALRVEVEEGKEAGPAWQHMLSEWALPVGAPFTQSSWADAKNKALAKLRAGGYPAATWATSTAWVDGPSNSVDLELVLQRGPLYSFGAVQVEGLSRYPLESILALQPFAVGDPVQESKILDYQERLRKLGWFETVAVELDTQIDTAGAAPVKVRVRERGFQQATAGAGWSDKTGPRVSLEHVHRQVWGLPWLSKNKLEWGREQQSWQGELLSYPLPKGYRNLVAGSYQTEVAAGTSVLSAWLRAGRTLDTENLERLVFIEALSAKTQIQDVGNGAPWVAEPTHWAASGNVHWLRQDLDNALLPTRGHSASVQLGAGYAWGGLTSLSGPFGRALGRLTAYQPLGAQWYGSARLEAGQVLAASAVGVPDTLLFRAGGDESVRGYGYRSVGPLGPQGVVRSARVLLTGSVELARPLPQPWSSLWLASFIDAGQAANHWSDLQPVWGYGVGLRWRSPVGPVRIDVAYGEAIRKTRLHVSLGVNF